MTFWAFLPLLPVPPAENDEAMEIFGLVIVILLLVGLAATSAFLRGRTGQTPPATSDQAWSQLDPPSTNYTMRIF